MESFCARRESVYSQKKRAKPAVQNEKTTTEVGSTSDPLKHQTKESTATEQK